MNAYRVHLHCSGDTASDTATIDLGSSQTFYAWCQMNMLDSRNNFDRDNAVSVDIFQVDGVRTNWRVSGGDHYGASNTAANLRQGAMSGNGRRVTFRLRAAHTSDMDAYATGIVLVL